VEQIGGAAILWLVSVSTLIAAILGKKVKIGSVELSEPTTRRARRALFGVAVLATFFGFLVWYGSPGSEQPTASPPGQSSPPGGHGTSPQSGGTQTTTQSVPAAPGKLKDKNATLKAGESVNMETEAVGKPVDNPDVTYTTGSCFCLGSSQISKISEAAESDTCAEELAGDARSTETADAGAWYCLKTTAGHVAAVYIGSTDDVNGEYSVHLRYIVWGS